jgi:hypothetical protein
MIGDTGAVVGIFSQPRESYTVESVGPDGNARWLVDFSPEDLEAVIDLSVANETSPAGRAPFQNPVRVEECSPV